MALDDYKICTAWKKIEYRKSVSENDFAELLQVGNAVVSPSFTDFEASITRGYTEGRSHMAPVFRPTIVGPDSISRSIELATWL